MASRERVFKINKVILAIIPEFCWKNFTKIELLSQELFMYEFQCKNSTIWRCYQWLGLSFLKPRSFLGIISKASQNKFHQIRITKSKVIHVQIPVPKWGKKPKKVGQTFLGYKTGQ